MAEGGIGCHRDTPSPNTVGHSLDSRLLECPICLEYLRQPKSLPCLHSFCQECLSTYIAKEPFCNMPTSFSCPVCRTVTQPVDPRKKRETWAKQFPTNNLIQELLQLQKKSQSPLYCKPCAKKGNIETPAQVFCKSLNMLFCEACRVNYHDVLDEGCNYLVIIKTDMIVPQETPDTIGEDYYEKFEESSKQEKLLQLLQKSGDNIGLLIQDFGDHLQELTRQGDTGLKSIRELRKKIDQRLDRLQKEITDELITTVKQEKESIEVALQQCEQLQTSILKTLESSKSAILKNNSLEFLLLYERGQIQVERCNDLATKMRETQKYVNVRHVVDPGQKTIGNDVGLNLGKIVVEKQTRQLTGVTELPTTPASECCVKEIRKFSIKTSNDLKDCDASGIVYLPDNHIVVGDYCNRNLKLYTDQGNFLDALKIRGKPRDMCMVDNNTVAVAVSYPGSVHVVSVQSSKLSLLYSMKGSVGNYCYGVTHRDGEFVVTTQEVYSITGGEKCNLLHTLSYNSYSLTCAPKPGDIYASQYSSFPGETAVSRLSCDTQTSMKIGPVTGAWGLDIDKEGNVYICGNDSHNIVQMSADGTNIRELLTASDGVRNPRYVAVCGDKFVVTTHGERNYVNVYQLC